jgi:hypothetical protein
MATIRKSAVPKIPKVHKNNKEFDVELHIPPMGIYEDIIPFPKTFEYFKAPFAIMSSDAPIQIESSISEVSNTTVTVRSKSKSVEEIMIKIRFLILS